MSARGRRRPSSSFLRCWRAWGSSNSSSGTAPEAVRAASRTTASIPAFGLLDQAIGVGLPAAGFLDALEQALGSEPGDPILLLGRGRGHQRLESRFAYRVGSLAHFLGAALPMLDYAAIEIASLFRPIDRGECFLQR